MRLILFSASAELCVPDRLLLYTSTSIHALGTGFISITDCTLIAICDLLSGQGGFTTQDYHLEQENERVSGETLSSVVPDILANVLGPSGTCTDYIQSARAILLSINPHQYNKVYLNCIINGSRDTSVATIHSYI